MKKKRDLNTVIIIDVESTCWDDPQENKRNTSEIIEVGWALVDQKASCIISNGSWLVKPRLSKISPFCTQLTTITQSMVDSGLSFQDVCDKIKSELHGPLRTWLSWGDYDRKQFERCCRTANVRYPFGISHINLKAMFSLLYGLERELGMDQALKHIGLPLAGTHHRGGDDAENIAKIYCKILSKFRREIGENSESGRGLAAHLPGILQ